MLFSIKIPPKIKFSYLVSAIPPTSIPAGRVFLEQFGDGS